MALIRRDRRALCEMNGMFIHDIKFPPWLTSTDVVVLAFPYVQLFLEVL